jgi:hypothetical protein
MQGLGERNYYIIYFLLFFVEAFVLKLVSLSDIMLAVHLGLLGAKIQSCIALHEDTMFCVRQPPR